MIIEEYYKMLEMNASGTDDGYRMCLCDRCAKEMTNRETVVEDVDDSRVYKPCFHCGNPHGFVRKIVPRSYKAA